MLPPYNVLLDLDHDGYIDSLLGAIYLCDPTAQEHVNAASELVAWLAQGALCLPLDVQTWAPPQPAIFIGERPLHDVPLEIGGTALYVYPDALLLTATTHASLLSGVRHLNRWPIQPTLQTLRQGSVIDPVVEKISFQDGLVTLHLTDDLVSDPDWSVLPADFGKLTTPASYFVNVNAIPSTQPSPEYPDRRSFSLAQAFQGGNLFSGTPHAPEKLLGSFSIEAPCTEALHVAAKLSTAGLKSPAQLTGAAEDASVRLLLDATVGAEVRVRETDKGSVLEIAGGSPQDLALAATYFGRNFPYLPDGTDLEGLEASLTAFLRGETPFGRVAVVAALQQRLGLDARRALLPSPPAVTPRLLGVPVTNTARDGTRTHWKTAFKWEGSRFLEIIASLTWTATDNIVVEGFLSETKMVRNTLQKQAEQLLKDRGVVGRVVLRSAYKPGLCWLLEDVGPRLALTGAVELHVRCAAQHQGLEARDRWLRELYPVVELLEQKYGTRVSLELADSAETYQAVAFDHSGGVIFEDYLTPPTAETPFNGKPEMGVVYPTTGQVTVHNGSQVLLEEHLPTDRDLLWQWFTGTVLPDVTSRVMPKAQGPYFGELSTVMTASEPDEPLDLDHEHLSATESLHEDIYFGTLEALRHTAGLDLKDRSFAPGRILPFCVVGESKDTKAQATLRTAGSYTLGLSDASGRIYEATHYPFVLHTNSVRLAPNATPQVTLHLELHSHEAASSFAFQLSWALAHRSAFGLWDFFPRQIRLAIQLRVAEQLVVTVEVPESDGVAVPSALPDRPLLAREVVDHARYLARRFPHARLRPLRESLYGAPLVALELTSPTPYASRARLTAWRPTVLVSARQHANEPSSTNAMYSWLEEELSGGALLRRTNVVFHPLENPDGARLHTALSQLAARHMHHAARYTGVGADLQTNPISRGAVIPESELRTETWRRWQPWLHLNCHGYPAHEWVRANGGYVPRHFEAWSLPFGYFTILASTPQHRELLEHLKVVVADALAQNTHLQQFTQGQIQRALRYLKTTGFPFTLVKEFPFLLTLEEVEEQVNRETFAPTVTVITEVPDETVSGPLWSWCIEAHQNISKAVAHRFCELLPLRLPSEPEKHVRYPSRIETVAIPERSTEA